MTLLARRMRLWSDAPLGEKEREDWERGCRCFMAFLKTLRIAASLFSRFSSRTRPFQSVPPEPNGGSSGGGGGDGGTGRSEIGGRASPRVSARESSFLLISAAFSRFEALRRRRGGGYVAVP